MSRFRLYLSVLLVSFGLSAAPTVGFSPPEGAVILSIEGHPSGPISFDRALLEALPSVRFTTTTIWTEGPQTFTGVPLAALLAHLGVERGTLRAIAANDYAVNIPVQSVTEAAPILAYLHNGAAMSLRDRGPLWVVYPYDSAPEFRREVIYSRSIWQLERIELQP